MDAIPGFNLSPIDADYLSRLQKHCTAYSRGAYVINPGKFLAPKIFVEKHQYLRNFKVKEDDVYVTNFPKTGSIWMQEIVWAMTHNPNLDNPKADLRMHERCPYFTTPIMIEEDNIPLFLNMEQSKNPDGLSIYDNLETPRIFKTHIHFGLMSPDVVNKARVVYMIRDPRDTFLSYYHFTKGIRIMYHHSNDINQFLEDYLNDRPFPGSYAEHIKQWWPLRKHPNVHTVFFENLKKDTMGELARLDKFLKTGLNEQQLRNVMHYSSISEMKKKEPLQNLQEIRKDFLPDISSFVRKGETGGAKTELSPEIWKAVTQHFKKGIQGIELPYDLNDTI